MAAGTAPSSDWQDFLVVFAYHPMYFNMRFQELEALASLHGVESQADLYVESPPPTSLSDSPLVQIRLPGGEATAREICERAVLIKAVLHVWGTGLTFKEAVASGLACESAELEARRSTLAPPQTMQIRVVAFGRTATMDEKRETIEQLKPLLRGDEIVDLHNSDTVIWALVEYRHWTGSKMGSKPESETPRRAIVGRQVAGGRSVDKKNNGDKAFFQRYDLSSRAVLGPTTMENQLAFIMANCAGATGGKIAMDPFCGTGGLLIALSHFGAQVVGGEIDMRVVKGWRVAYLKNKAAALEVAAARQSCSKVAEPADRPGRGAEPADRPVRSGCSLTLEHLAEIGIGPAAWQGKKELEVGMRPNALSGGKDGKRGTKGGMNGESATNGKGVVDLQTDIFTNFFQYKLAVPEIVICDAARRPWREVDSGWLDCIVTDPPYGVRAASKKQGRDPAQVTGPVDHGPSYIPSKVSYGEEELNHDLLELAAKSLKDGGRMTYLLPVDLADFLGIDRAAESGDIAPVAATASDATVESGRLPQEGRQWATRLSGQGSARTLHDAAMPKTGRVNKDPRLCISETTRDPLLLDEARYLDFLPQHAALELSGASLQVLSGGLGRLLVTMRRRPRGVRGGQC